MLDLLIFVGIAAVVVGIVCYLRREKKKGVTCIGCPYAGQCSRSGSGSACGRQRK